MHGTREWFDQNRLFVAQRIGNANQLRGMRDELLRPASAQGTSRSDEHSRRERSVDEMLTLRVITARAGVARGLEATRLAAQQRVGNDTLADPHILYGRSNFED